MLFAVIKRYLFPYFIITIVASFLWGSMIMMADGWIPALAFILFLVAIFATIPVLAYMDYRDVKAMVIEIIEVKKGNKTVSQAEVTQKAIGMISEKLSLPEFLVAFFVNKAIEKYESGKTTSLAQDSSAS